MVTTFQRQLKDTQDQIMEHRCEGGMEGFFYPSDRAL